MINPFQSLQRWFRWANRPTIDPTRATKKPVMLISLDGYGIAPDSPGNAITRAEKPNLDRFQNEYLWTELVAAGEAVGLPANEVGNSEVGHLIMGAGRVMLQSLMKINKAIEDNTFFENKAFIQTFNHVKENNSTLHLLGMVGLGGKVHSSIDHFMALLDFCKLQRVPSVAIHLITDGRDSPPDEVAEVVAKIEEKIAEVGVGRLASISGRFYAMDRDLRWERTEQTYNAIVGGEGVQVSSNEEAIAKAKERNETDEFIQPTIILGEDGQAQTINDNDGIIFFNFRVDRPRQLASALADPEFEKLETFEVHRTHEHGNTERAELKTTTFIRRKKPKNLFFTTMTEYHKSIPVNAVAFPPEDVPNSLPEVLGQHNLKHLHASESEKQRMVNVYFNGLQDEPHPGGEVLVVPSPRVPKYDKKPEMSAYELGEELIAALAKDEYDFFIVNFANPDMVAHTGNLQASIKAVEVTDEVVGEVVDAVLSLDGVVLITADHGNAEELLSYSKRSFFFTSKPGDVNTDHSNSPVPLFIIGNQYRKGGKLEARRGALSDVAPTILDVMNLEKPPEMTGHSVLEPIEVADTPPDQA